MRVSPIERRIGKRHLFAVGNAKLAAKALLFEVGASEIDGRRGDIHTGDLGAALCEASEVDAPATADLKNATASISVEVNQMMELLEMIPIQVIEETARSVWMAGDLQIVNVPVPVLADRVNRRHEQTIS